MLRTTLIKAFTKNPTRGNPAVVIEGPVDAEETLKVVREASCYTAAVIDTRHEDHIPIRFFYEHGRTETFACGHATLAAAQVSLPEGVGEVRKTLVNQKGATIEIVRFSDGRISQQQPVPELQDTDISPKDIAEVLGINPDQILTDLPIQLAGSPGKMKLLIPVTRETLLGLKGNFAAIKNFCDAHPTITGLFPFALDTKGFDAHARHFPKSDQEDLVCGVGALALAKYLRHHRSPEQNQFIILCGPGSEGAGEVIVRREETETGEKMFLEGFAVSIAN